eukprot:6172588-Pleurochrysis_carterae.AAC.2
MRCTKGAAAGRPRLTRWCGWWRRRPAATSRRGRLSRCSARPCESAGLGASTGGCAEQQNAAKGSRRAGQVVSGSEGSRHVQDDLKK